MNLGDWREDALCRKAGPELFYPADNDEPRGSGRDLLRIREARAVCARCPVTTQCRAEADRLETDKLTKQHVHGVWAGETPTQRLKRRALARTETSAA